MHTGKHLVALLATLGLFTLAACGGGSSTGTKTMAEGEKTMAEGEAEVEKTPAQVNRVRTADPEKTVQSTKAAAGSLPRFGSVTQSTKQDANGVATDLARAEFDGAGLTVTVTRADASPLTLDTADPVTETAVRDTMFNIPGGARTLRSWETLNLTDRAATVTGLGVTYASDDPSDWLAAGVWLHIAGQNLLSTAPTVTIEEAGAFVDGPELRSPPANLPGTGTASYEGYAGGSYAVQYGTGYPDTDGSVIAPGSTELGGFEAIATLTANFADNTISGCIGCKGDILVEGVFTDGATGAQEIFTESEPSDTELRLGAAAINSDGTFRASDVTLLDAGARQAGLGVTEQGGSWGGRFSNIPVATGEPRLAAGTFGGTASYTGGSQVNYIGTFGAGKQ